MVGYVYIIQSLRNGRYYIGSSEDPEKRLNEFHNKGIVKATRYMTPWRIVFQKEFDDITEARKMEYRLKQKKSRVIIEKIIENKKLDICWGGRSDKYRIITHNVKFASQINVVASRFLV